ncbi:MAG: hypothetical protein NVS4B7_16780 [Ktedonobacteraceae bacterium]
MASKTAPPSATRQPGLTDQGTGNPVRSIPPPPKPKPASGGTSHWLDAQNDVKVGQPDQPPRPKLPPSPAPRDNRGAPERGGNRGPGNYRDERGFGPGGYREDNNRSSGNYRGPGGYRENDYRSPNSYRSPAPYRVGGGMGLPDTDSPRPRQPMTGDPMRDRGPRPGGPGEPRQEKFRPDGKPGGPKTKAAKPKPETPPKPKREKIPPPAPFQPTAEQVVQVEARYKELAVPAEYDGIRTQIASELSIPKNAVKKIIKEFREKEHIPSWWDIQSYKGDSEELERIKALYEPLLPVPAVGVHKQIAEQLSLKPADVYQAIKAIRQEMKLPQYNDPALHGLEPILPDQKKIETPALADSEANEKEAETAMPGASEADEKKAETVVPKANEVDEKSAETPVSLGNAADTAMEEIDSHGQISFIETDTVFHKEGDTIEISAADVSDTNTHSEA